MDDQIGPQLAHQTQDSRAVANVELVMTEMFKRLLEPALVPAGISAGANEHGALVVVDAVDLESAAGEEGADFGANQTG